MAKQKIELDADEQARLPRLTHRIVVDSGQWVRGATEAEALATFRKMHSTRRLTHKQVWAVTEKTYITDDGRFAGPKLGWVSPVRVA